MRYFEDIEIGKQLQAGPYQVSEGEIVEFATRWDPRPYHTDPHAALQTPFKGLAASGAHTISIYYRLLYNLGHLEQEPLAAIAALGFEVKLPRPVRPGDQLTLTSQPIEKRDSEKNPKAGIARTKGTLTNQSGEVVLEIVATGLFAKRPT
jgi:acyl dehydratase